MKNLDQVIREGNSTVNQNIKSKFVGQHVYCNVGTLVQPFIKSFDIENAPFNMEYIENMFEYPEYNGKEVCFSGGSQEFFDDAVGETEALLAELEERLEEMDTDEDNEETNQLKERIADLEDELNEFRDLKSQPQEIFEWWAVSSFLFDKLKALNHPVLDAGSCLVWGRCTTGQAILLDYAITQICAEMGILEGQEHSWANSQGV